MATGTLKNNSNVDISISINWSTGGIKNDIIKPAEEIEIECGDDIAILCHRSDGGTYGICPTDSRTFQAGDYYKLLEDGEYEN
ncbi:hypothetical protein [Chryseobacterium sp.]|uniref:hypothetical protein n=1 Tax=Chryseobacterium sp. TaxID=1871047 RepID=UPI0012A914F2|nr:hypothetical protein [Chryseobacterium sp.]QFG52719.1 hypothetical protein F7R58_03890 [Chryseobacterium sp.]